MLPKKNTVEPGSKIINLQACNWLLKIHQVNPLLYFIETKSVDIAF